MNSIKAKREAIASIRLHKRLIHGVLSDIWDVYLGKLTNGQKVRFASSLSKDELILKIDEFYKKYATMGDTTLILTPTQVYDAKNAMDLLTAAGVPLSLTEAINRLLDGRKVAKASTITIGEAYNRYYAGIRDIQVEQKKSVRLRVLPWVQSVGMETKLTEITCEGFKDYAAGLKKFQRVKGNKTIQTKEKVSDKTRNNVIGYCKTFMQWCVSEKYLDENPIADTKMTQMMYEEPEYTPVEDVRKTFDVLVAAGDKAIIAYAALSFFVGIRASEIQGIANDTAKAFLLEDNTVRIMMPKGLTRGITPRTIELEKNARAWLEYADAAKTMSGCKVDTLRDNLHTIMAKHGIEFCHNAGRHSYITYHVAVHHIPEMTAGLAGNSPKMIKEHYKGLATTSQGNAFFAIMPPQTV